MGVVTRRPARSVAVLLALGATLGVLASCTPFGSDATGMSPADAGESDASAPGDASTDVPDGRADAVDANATPSAFCSGARFCDTFEEGDLGAATLRWGDLDVGRSCESACGAAVLGDNSVAGKFFQAKTPSAATSYIRLARSIGTTTPASQLRLRLDVRFTAKGDYEIAVFNLYNSGGAIAGDVAVRVVPSGGLIAAWSNGGPYTKSAATVSVADGAWHTVSLVATSGSVIVSVDNNVVEAPGSPLADPWPEARLNVGTYVYSGPAAVIAFDNVRFDGQ